MKSKFFRAKAGVLSILLLVLTLFMTFAFAACNKNVNHYTLPDVTEGDTFEITVDSYASGGYSWSYEIKPNSGIEYVKEEFITDYPSPDHCGGGQNKFIFKATKAGKYDIKFTCQRSWESEPPIYTNIYKIKVLEAK